MTTSGHHALYHRIRGRLGSWRGQTYSFLGPKMLAKGAKMSGLTVATLEYPFRSEPRWGWGRPAHPQLSEILGQGRDRYRDVMSTLSRHVPELRKVSYRSVPGQPCWDNIYWTGLDAVIQYAAIASRRPSTYIEVGSGNSTLFARRAVQDHDLATRIVSIDPSPRADVDASCDSVHRVPLERVDTGLFWQLQAGDILLIDGTHTAFMGSDAVVTFLEVLPGLAPGVLVGIHDIFLPWDYPPEWVDRWYGEQYLAATLLLAQPAQWQVTLPAWYVCKETDLGDDLDEVWDLFGDPPGRTGVSLWLERVQGAAR